jgi:hypothetical protein
MTPTLLLIHGGQHGGWCWSKVQERLAELGVDSVAPDLPFEDESAGAREWARAAVDALGDRTGPVVAVAHSLGGMCLPSLAAIRPLERMVFLAAMVPVPGSRYIDYLGSEDARDAITIPMTAVPGPDEPVRAGVSWHLAREYFYPDCSEDDAVWAWDKLRSNPLVVFTEPSPVDAWPDVPSTYVVMAGDRCVNPVWSRRAAQRIGADVVELPGGHSPFLFAPDLLAETLQSIAGRAQLVP